MPAAAVTREVAFARAPHAAPNDKVAVHVPATFDAGAPFLLCVFMHGLSGEVPFEDHIRRAIAQLERCAANVVLVAPRFGDRSAPGAFDDPAGFPAFIDELRHVLPQMAPLDADAVARAPIVLAVFSGGWRPLTGVLNGLLASASPCADRIKGILLLDSVFGPLSSAAIIAWQRKRRAQAALLSIYGRDTLDDARDSNLALIEVLKPTGPVRTPASWDDVGDFPPGTVVFLEVTTPHIDITSDGPPAAPIAAFLGLLGHRPAKSA
jgi:hypothetical protein